jgi:squalene-associated FAD-dependent desaturase
VTTERVVVVGGGLAGISAALRVAEAGVPVTVLEARPWLGGATWSFGRRGLTIDNGQHVFLRCYTAYRDLLARLGVAGLAEVQDRLDLTVLTPDGPLRLRRSDWPAPLHLAPMLARYRPLAVPERLAVLQAALAMWLSDLAGPSQQQASVGDWLARHGQGERARSEFWDMFLVPALNAAAAEADLGTAAGFINAALLSGRDQADLGMTTVPLRDLHAGPAGGLLARLGADVRTQAEVTAIEGKPGGGFAVLVGAPGQGGARPDSIRAAGVVLAVPAWAAAALVPAELRAGAASWGVLRPAPMVNIHVLYDARVTGTPFALVAGSPIRWLADKTGSAGLHTGQYLAATVPAASRYADESPADLRERFLPELERLLPAAAAAKVEDFFVTRERSATFAPVPGSRASRPDQVTALAGFALAGAWTDTGWPDTMEGAVRSGNRAAESVLGALSGPFAGSLRPSRAVPADPVPADPVAGPALDPAGDPAVRS